MSPNGLNKLAMTLIGSLAALGILGAVGVYGQQRSMEPRLEAVEEAAKTARETRDRVIVIEKDIEHIKIDQKEFQERADKAHDEILEELRRR